jgi:type IV pilus assembly protein PilC
MPIYECQYQLPDGTAVTDYITARTEEQVYALIEGRGGEVLRIARMREVGAAGRHPVNSRNLSLAFLQISSLLAAGISLTEALKMTASQFAPPLGTLLDAVQEKVAGGINLSEALSQHKEIPKHVVGAIRGGEATGKLRQVLEEIAEALDRAAYFRGMAISALTYPTIIFIFSIVVALGMILFLVPSMLNGLSGIAGGNMELPLPTKILLFISRFLLNPLGGGSLLLAFLGGGYYLVSAWRAEGEARERMEKLLLRLPFISYFFAISQLVAIARLLSLTLSSGLTLPQSMTLTAQGLSSVLYRKALDEARVLAESGLRLSVALNRYPHLFSNLFRSLVAVGEEGATVAELLAQVRSIYERDYELRLKGLSSAIEPILLVFVGAVVGGIMVAMLLPYFSVLGKIQGF